VIYDLECALLKLKAVVEDHVKEELSISLNFKDGSITENRS